MCRTISASRISLIQMWNTKDGTVKMCPEIWQSSGFKPLHHYLPFVSETLEPVETLQPVQEVPKALLNVARLFIFIIRLLQQQQCVCVCVGVSFKFRHFYLCPLLGLMLYIMSEKNENCKDDCGHVVRANSDFHKHVILEFIHTRCKCKQFDTLHQDQANQSVFSLHISDTLHQVTQPLSLPASLCCFHAPPSASCVFPPV